MKNNITPIANWFKTAKPEPDRADICVQIGCHYEEVSEMMDATGDSLAVDVLADNYKNMRKDYIDAITFDNDDKVELLDSLCDQIVTAIGVAEFMGMDIQGALNEVNRSNWSKFENGKVVLNENGKIKKGKDYTPPNLLPFIGDKEF